MTNDITNDMTDDMIHDLTDIVLVFTTSRRIPLPLYCDVTKFGKFKFSGQFWARKYFAYLLTMMDLNAGSEQRANVISSTKKFTLTVLLQKANIGYLF